MNRVPRSGLDDQVIEDLRRLNELDVELYRRARARFAPTTPSFWQRDGAMRTGGDRRGAVTTP